ncbi:hypothetical protein HDV00_004791 [Rhizophlyctis rosea]|nr:hypothetical protein HDV00_004791 [Rhizophlyctis rosea]
MNQSLWMPLSTSRFMFNLTERIFPPQSVAKPAPLVPQPVRGSLKSNALESGEEDAEMGFKRGNDAHAPGGNVEVHGGSVVRRKSSQNEVDGDLGGVMISGLRDGGEQGREEHGMGESKIVLPGRMSMGGKGKGKGDEDADTDYERRYERHVRAKLIQWMNENLALNMTVRSSSCAYYSLPLPHSP